MIANDLDKTCATMKNGSYRMLIINLREMEEKKQQKPALDLSNVTQWVAVSNQLPNFDETVLVYCSIYGRFLATYEHIGDFEGEKYGNWRDFKGNLGILPPVYWMKIPEPPCG